MLRNPRFEFKAANPGYISPKLPLTDPLELQGKAIPEREWIVTNWIPHSTVTMLGGDGGIGKSLLAMQLLTAVAIGHPWLGLPTVSCKAIGFYCEDDFEEIWRRQAAVNRHYGVEFADLENLKWKSLVGADAALIGFEHDRGEPDGTGQPDPHRVHRLRGPVGRYRQLARCLLRQRKQQNSRQTVHKHAS